MKQIIIASLKTKYQRFGLSNEAIDRIASAKEKTVTPDSDIATAIADAETMGLIANELQKMRDKEIQNRTDLQASFNEYKEKHPDTNPDPNPNPNPSNSNSEVEPEWAKKLREQQEAITARFEAEDKAKKSAADLSAVEARLKSAGCTNPGILKSVLKGFSLGENEDVDMATLRLKGEYNSTYKETFGEGPRPGLGGGEVSGDPKKSAEAMNEYLRKEGLLPDKE